jgi:hypothetical protein
MLKNNPVLPQLPNKATSVEDLEKESLENDNRPFIIQGISPE